MEHKVFESLKEGNKTLKALHDEVSLEAVEDLMSETADAIAYQNVHYLFSNFVLFIFITFHFYFISFVFLFCIYFISLI